MRRATPRQVGSLCQRCAVLPTQSPQGALALRSILSQAQRASRNNTYGSNGKRWLATAADEARPSVPVPSHNKIVASALKRSNPVAKVDEQLATFAEAVKDEPNQQVTHRTLQACLEAASSLGSMSTKAESQIRASAGRLAQLGAERTGQSLGVQPVALQNVMEKVSEAAYHVVTHPNVEMTPHILEAYVHIQSQLGRPETLPYILQLFACKAKPMVKDGKVQYVPQNPNSPTKAIHKDVADIALQTAIDAKHLDAALGITEASFCVKAFKRQKLIKKATIPALVVLSMPVSVLGLAAGYGTYLQNTLDTTTATVIGSLAIGGYIFGVGFLGLIAKGSNKDHMKRVTWISGTPLRYRWIREEEREAMDKIALAWGFKETWRYGEESGAEWEGLRDYMGYRGMFLDRVEFLQGMN